MIMLNFVLLASCVLVAVYGFNVYHLASSNYVLCPLVRDLFLRLIGGIIFVSLGAFFFEAYWLASGAWRAIFSEIELTRLCLRFFYNIVFFSAIYLCKNLAPSHNGGLESCVLNRRKGERRLHDRRWGETG